MNYGIMILQGLRVSSVIISPSIVKLSLISIGGVGKAFGKVISFCLRLVSSLISLFE